MFGAENTTPQKTTTMNSTTAAESNLALPWLAKDLNLESMVRVLVALVSLVAALSVLFSLPFLRVKRASYVLSRVKVKHTRQTPDYLLARPEVIASLQKALEHYDYKTVLVYGQRGSGKTTAIEQTLGSHLGVVQWTLAADEGPAATKELHERWTRLFDPWKKQYDQDFELDVCASILNSRGKSLVIVISVESSAKPAALKNVLHFCKTMSYNTQLVRFVVDISSSRAALQTDLKKLRIIPVAVGCVTTPEANALVYHKLPNSWTDPQKQAVSYEITDKFDLLLLTLIEVCDNMVGGMSTAEALEQVNKVYEGQMFAARHRLLKFDKMVKEKFNEWDDELPVPNLLKEDPDTLDADGMQQLFYVLPLPDLMAIVTEIGAPYIFDVDPFYENPTLNGKIMTKAFIQHYKQKKNRI